MLELLCWIYLKWGDVVLFVFNWKAMSMLKLINYDLFSVKTIFKPAVSLFLLREQKFPVFNFHCGQSILLLTVIIFLELGAPDRVSQYYLWWHFGLIVLIWFSIALMVYFIKWWLQRGRRWDGQGALFNVLVASWLVGDLLDYFLTLSGVQWQWLIPLNLYTCVVSCKAIAGVIPQASLRYIVAGCVLSLMVMLLPLLLMLLLVWGWANWPLDVNWSAL